jgi:hypothetical protein
VHVNQGRVFNSAPAVETNQKVNSILYCKNMSWILKIFRKYKVNFYFILIGSIALLIGALVYYVDRPPNQTYFVIGYSEDLSMHDSIPNLFGIVGESLPDFIHVFSFILLTAGVSSCGKKGYCIICLSWLFIDSTFELGQKFLKEPMKGLPDWFDGIPMFEAVKSYFIRGTFDYIDLISIVLGTVAAYMVLIKITEIKDNDYSPETA